jgi:predicted nucleic acid-binding protein
MGGRREGDRRGTASGQKKLTMPLKLVLDTGPLGVATGPTESTKRNAIRAWLTEMVKAKASVIVPGIADYELRREMILQGMEDAITRLDLFRKSVRYVPIGERVMRQAAVCWAEVRATGKPTAGDKTLDGDCILAATAWSVTRPGDAVVVITANVKDLVRFPGITAREWQDMKL